MFFVDEIEKVLDLFAEGGRGLKDIKRMRVTLPDIGRVDIEQMQLSKKVRYPISTSPPAPLVQDIKPFDDILAARLKSSPLKHISTNNLFLQLINNALLKQLEQTPMREYPSAKLMICDQYSYDLLIKLKRIVSSPFLGEVSGAQNFIHSSQFNVTAIFHIDDIVDTFTREQEPLIIMKGGQRTGQKVATFNYQIVRRVFPSLRMSDLILLMRSSDNLKLGVVALKGSQTHLVLQLLNHYARSTRLIELSSIDKNLGFLHHLYDNLLVFTPLTNSLRSTREDPSDRGAYDITLAQLASMAQRLLYLASRFRLKLTDINYRVKDPRRQTKVFSELVKTNLDPKQVNTFDAIPARVLVIDRFYDLQIAMTHADAYGAFLEQEHPTRTVGDRALGLRYDTCCELDEKLVSVPLSDVLHTILNYALSLRPEDVKDGRGRGYIPSVNKSLLSALTTSQSIRRHLQIVKSVYKCLNEGYLLVLRIESSIESSSNELRSLKEPLAQEQQDQLAERLNRVASAFRQLLKISGESISAVDIVRTACTLLDTVNFFLAIHDRDGRSSVKACRTLYDIRTSILRCKDFSAALRSKIDNQAKREASQLLDQLTIFDRISRENCGNKSTFTLEQILERFVANEIDTNSFINISLAEKSSDDTKTIVLVFLGTITPKEVGRIKALETSLKQTGKIRDILVLSHSMDTPGSFLMSLE